MVFVSWRSLLVVFLGGLVNLSGAKYGSTLAMLIGLGFTGMGGGYIAHDVIVQTREPKRGG